MNNRKLNVFLVGVIIFALTMTFMPSNNYAFLSTMRKALGLFWDELNEGVKKCCSNIDFCCVTQCEKELGDGSAFQGSWEWQDHDECLAKCVRETSSNCRALNL